MRVKLADGTWRETSDDARIIHELPVPIYQMERLWDGLEYTVIQHIMGYQTESVVLEEGVVSYLIDLNWWNETKPWRRNYEPE